MNVPSFDVWKREAQEQGFDEVIERKWPPSTVLPSHVHPFSLRALVVEGEMWLTVGDEVRFLKAGDEFAIEREVPHAERYGEQGATYWVARRNKPAQ